LGTARTGSAPLRHLPRESPSGRRQGRRSTGGGGHTDALSDKLRRLLHFGQTLQSHALHFFHLSSPDLLFGFGSDLAKRNIVGVLEAYPEIAVKGVKLRKYGQEVIRMITGKRFCMAPAPCPAA